MKKSTRRQVMIKRLWKSMSSGLRSGYNGEKWKIGEWKKIKGEPRLCKNGYHASRNIIDAMQYTNLECLAKVEVRGESDKQSDKQAWTEMRVVKAWKWEKKDSVALSVYAAELVIDNFEKKYPDDKRPRKAIEAAKAWLKNPTKQNQSAARSAAESARSAESAAESAWSAARSAVWSARPAAWSAAESAVSAVWSARSAVWSAAESARSAAESARSAAWSAAWSAVSAAESADVKGKCHRWVVRHTKELVEVTDE